MAFIPPVSPPLLYPPFPRVQNVEAPTVSAPVPSSRNGGTAVPAAAPPAVLAAAPSARMSFAAAAPSPVVTTYVSPVTTQRQINSTFRIVDLRLNNQAP